MRALPLLLLATACATAPDLPDCPPGAHLDLILYDRGIHTEINLPASALRGRPAALARGAPAVRLGFGKRGFFDQPDGPGLAAYALAPLPGPAVIETVPAAGAPDPGLSAPAIGLPLSDAAGLNRFLDRSLPAGPVPEGRFIPAAQGYSLAYTCNTWVAEALEQGGLPVSPLGVSRAPGVLRQAARVPGACRVTPPGDHPR
ncbi:DUF2459 domain-containing protein [Sabulicella glaciei]|uniref:DUF2459 domain-containing protein n=1 Tax=Sabulicella glaciei TaxID=2984948 RepID=A0ABT3P0W1_9PROT|nr:DUF2459 domain-containing protein [Roseococcus sp. MDT2-1-1]MCW8088048.1 DUF2459 domain-containing protein [Roseococcus sp. MDT2-1-1]